MSHKGGSPSELAALPFQKSGTDDSNLAAVDPIMAACGFNATEANNLNTGSVSAESVMPPKKVEAALNAIYKQLGVPMDNTSRILFLNTLLKYFIINGTSSKARPNTNITVQGRSYDVGVILGILDRDLRRFARAFANQAHRLLKADSTLANELVKRRGWPQNLADYCFDFSLFCSHLTPGEATAIRIASARTIDTSTKKPGARAFENMMFEPTAAGSAPYDSG